MRNIGVAMFRDFPIDSIKTEPKRHSPELVRDSLAKTLASLESRTYQRGSMQKPTDINEPIVEALYCEALVLADEVRQVFDLNPIRQTGGDADVLRLALSVEGLRTTTRIMHVLAWLLNQRAYFNGELTEFQLRRHSKLPPDRASEPANLQYLEDTTCHLIRESENLHARISRLDAAWRDRFEMRPAAILRLHERLNQAVGGN